MKPKLIKAAWVALLAMSYNFMAFAQCDMPIVVVSDDFDYHCLGDSLFASIPELEFFSCEDDRGEYSYCYDNNESTVFTYCPDTPGDGTMIVITMNAGSFENGFDTITVFDGADDSAPVMGSHEGSVAGISYIATNTTGCITFRIDSDFTISCASGSQLEFEYTISCGQLEDLYTVNWEPSEMVSNPNSLNTGIIDINSDQEFTITITDVNDEGCFTQETVNVNYVESVDLGQPGVLDLCTTFDPVQLFSGLEGSPDDVGLWLDPEMNEIEGSFDPGSDPSGIYYYTYDMCPDQLTPVEVNNYEPPSLDIINDFNYVCEGEILNVDILNEINTDPCSESNGTYEYCYSDDEETLFTYCPDEAGAAAMSVQFLSGNLEVDFDYITVYDGDNIEAPILGVLNGQIAGNAFTATNPSGCITLLLTSDGSVNCEENVTIEELLWLVSCQQDEYPYDIQWDNADLVQDPNSTSTNIFGLETDTEFTVTVAISDVPECATSASVDVTYVDNINIGMDTELTVCEGSDELNLTEVLDGDPEPLGVWTDSEGNIIAGTYDPVPGTIETFFYTNPNCVNSTELIVSTGVLPDVDAGPDQAICSGESAILEATGANSFEWVGLPPGNPLTVTPFEQTTYTVIGADLFGCTSTDEVIVTVLGGENLEITEEDGFLTVAVSEGIQWYLNGLPILGANQQTIPITGEGTYSVVVDSGGECGEVESAPYEVIFPGIASLQNQLIIYPNPSNGLFNFKSEQGLESIQVYSLDGRIILIDQYNGKNSVLLDLSQQPSGIYAAMVRLSDGSSNSIKIQIQ